MTTKQNKLFYVLLKKLGLSKSDKEVLVWNFTNKRTSRSSEMSPGEVCEVLKYLKDRSMRSEVSGVGSELLKPSLPTPGTSSQLLKKIKSYGVKCCGYKYYETDIDWSGKVIPCICKVAKKRYWSELTRLDNKALIKILHQLEKIYARQCEKGFELELDEVLKQSNISKYDDSDKN